MMAKTQIALETEMQRRARQRANDLGVSLAEYFRRLLARDLARPETAAHVDRVFDLGTSGGSDVASQKDSMVADAFQSTRGKRRRRR
jgi:predicted nucleic acid-binding protein